MSIVALLVTRTAVGAVYTVISFCDVKRYGDVVRESVNTTLYVVAEIGCQPSHVTFGPVYVPEQLDIAELSVTL